MQKPDFQEHELWRSIVYEHLAYIAANTEDVIIVPMTITDPTYYKEIIGNLRMEGHQTYHLVLTASEETLRARLAKRGQQADFLGCAADTTVHTRSLKPNFRK
ncbi:hypothetical protein SFC02_05515 [Terribacillus goriensis]|uniref:AAA family ATPase n=1 Tax=Terribacillus saccharophilus TaxID=361277 RepID=UPI0039834EBA